MDATSLSSTGLNDFGKPLPQSTGQNTRQLQHIPDDEVIPEGKRVEILDRRDPHLARDGILGELGGLQVEDARALGLASGGRSGCTAGDDGRCRGGGVDDDEDDHDALLAGAAHQLTNTGVVLAYAVRDDEHELPELAAGA